MQNGLKYEMSRLISVCVWIWRASGDVTTKRHIEHTYTVEMYNTHIYVCKYGETTFFQKADRNDMKWCEDTNSSPKWYFEPLSWCFFSGCKHTRVSDHVFSTTWCGGIRCSNTFGNAEKVSKDHSDSIMLAYDKYSHFLWFVRKDHASL